MVGKTAGTGERNITGNEGSATGGFSRNFIVPRKTGPSVETPQLNSGILPLLPFRAKMRKPLNLQQVKRQLMLMRQGMMLLLVKIPWKLTALQ